MPLQFVDSTTTLRYMFLLDATGALGPNRTEFTILAHRVTEGVLPKGSMWSKIPVPAGSWAGADGWQGN
jgi:hypothetical protein